MPAPRIGCGSSAALLGALCLSAGSAIAGPPQLPLEQAADGIFVHRGAIATTGPDNGGDIANIGFIVGSRCVAVIDSGGTRTIGAALLAALRQRTDKPVCYVIHTHVHPDHGFGDAAFTDPGTVFVAHAEFPVALAARRDGYRRALDRLLGEQAAGSGIAVPTVLVDGEQQLDLGDRPLRLRAWPTAHTHQDLTVFDQRTRTLWTGDLLFVDHVPVVDGKAIGWLTAIDALLAIKADHLIPGHGPVPRDPASAFAAQRRYLQVLVSECRRAVQQGQTLTGAIDTVGLGEHDHWQLFDDYHRRNVTAVYTEVEWEN
ncbi:MAG: MBL fold metallo-hydrolase [Xanthomonadaceae bacterium]|nr:MBL fold metallo-hydrolase [Xanthomonadaceae bacterium]